MPFKVACPVTIQGSLYLVICYYTSEIGDVLPISLEYLLKKTTLSREDTRK